MNLARPGKKNPAALSGYSGGSRSFLRCRIVSGGTHSIFPMKSKILPVNGLAFASAGLFFSQPLLADDITLTATNAIGTSSFESALNWSNNEAPSAAHDYFVTGGFALRTVVDSGSATFLGRSLTLGNGATAGTLIFKNQPTGSVITVDNLTLNNGEIQAGATGGGGSHIVTIAGNGITLVGAANRLNTGSVASRQIIVASPVSGDGGLVKNAAGYAKLTGANTYTGGTVVNAGVLNFAGPSPTAGATIVNAGTLSVPLGGGEAGDFTGGLTGAGTLGGILEEGLGAGTSTITLADGTGLGIDTGRAVGTQTYGGEFDRPLLKLGAGTLALSGGGSYAGAGGAGYPFIVRQGELHLAGGNHAVTGELVVGGDFGTLPGAVGYDAKLQVDAGRLEISTWLSVGRGNGTGTVSSDLEINNDAVVTAQNFSGGFSGGNALNTPRGSITLNDDASLTVATTTHLAESAGTNYSLILNGTSTATLTNTVNIAGGANATALVEVNGTSTLQQTANANQTRVGNADGAVGTIHVKGGTAFFERDLILGYAGTGTGKLILDSGTVNMAGGTKRWLKLNDTLGSKGELTVNGGNLNLNTNTDLRFSTNANATGTSVATLNGGAITGFTGNNNGVISGVSVVDLNQGSTNGGVNNTFNLDGGTLTIGQIVTTQNSGTVAFNFNGGTLKAAASTANFVDLGGASQTANVKDDGAIIDTNGFNVTIPQALVAAGTGGLTKTGSGTLTLAGQNTYLGLTRVEEGTLALGALGRVVSAIVVEEDAAIGSGQGEVQGSLTLNSGALLSASVNSFEPLHVEDGVTFAGPASLVFSATPVNGTHSLFSYGAGGVTNLGNLTSNYRVNIVDNTANSEVVGTVQIGSLNWNTTNGNWQVGAGGWSGGFPNYFDADSVTFLERPGPSVVTLVGTLRPGDITVDNTTNPYTFTGPGSIAGDAWLDKFGAGALTIATANSYTGGTFLIEGTLNIDHASALGTGRLTIQSGVIDNTSGAPIVMTGNNEQDWLAANIVFTGSDSLDMGAGAVTVRNEEAEEPGDPTTVTVGANTLTVGEIKASNGLIKQGPGTLEVTSAGAGGAASVITGVLQVAEGVLQINRTGPNGAASGDFTVSGLTGGGTLVNGAATERWFFSTPASGDSYEFAGTLANGGSGALGFNLNGAGAQTLSGTLTYTGQTTVGGGGTLTLAVENTGAGTNTTVNNGTLVLAHPDALGETSTIRLAGDNVSTLRFAADGNREEPYGFVFGTGVNSTIVADRATAGPEINHRLTTLGIAGVGGGTLTVTSGENVPSGAGRITFPLFGLSAGSSQTTTLNPTTANVTLVDVLKVAENPAQTLGLGGSSQDNHVTGVIANGTSTVAVIKSGASTWTLSGNSTYTGATAVNAGTLVVTGNNSAATGAVTVASGATLAGNGNLGGNVTVNALGIHSLAVAATPGAQATRVIGGSLNHLSGSVLTLTAASQPIDGEYIIATAGGIALDPSTTINLVGIADAVVSVLGNNLVLTVGEGGSGPGGFGTWASHPEIDLPSGSAGFSDNPDNDGFDNGIEYILGGHPLDGANNPKIYSLIADSNDPGDEQELILTIALPQGAPAFAEGVQPGIDFEGFRIVVRGSTDLADFGETVRPVATILPAGVTESTFVQGGVTYGYRSFSLVGSNGLPGRGFLQVVVTNP